MPEGFVIDIIFHGDEKPGASYGTIGNVECTPAYSRDIAGEEIKNTLEPTLPGVRFVIRSIGEVPFVKPKESDKPTNPWALLQPWVLSSSQNRI